MWLVCCAGSLASDLAELQRLHEETRELQAYFQNACALYVMLWHWEFLRTTSVCQQPTVLIAADLLLT